MRDQNTKDTKSIQAFLRARAEKHLGEMPEGEEAVTPPDTLKLLQDLRIHQIELEIQNEELRRVQEELEGARAKYFELFDLAPVGYLTLRQDGIILEANLTVAHLLGIEKRQLIGKPFSRFISPESQDAFYLYRKTIRESEGPQACELKLQKKDADPFFVHLEGRFVSGASGADHQILISVVDIHEKVQALEALKERAIKNETLLNLLPHPAMLIDRSRKILAANQLAMRSGAEVGGFWFPENGGETPGKRGGRFGKREDTLPFHPQGPGTDEIPLAKSLGKSARVEGVFRLVDEEQNSGRLVTIVQDSNDAVLVFDFQGNILAWNKGAENIYGYSGSEALKMTVFDLIPSRLQKEMKILLRDVRSGVLVPPFETRRVAKDGCLLDIRLTVSPLMQNEKIIAVATTERDVTEYNRWLASIKDFPRRIILAQEGERGRISREIHSDLGQSLLALKIFLVMTASELPKGNVLVKKALEKAKERLSRIIDKARDLSHTLAPPSLKSNGLAESIKMLIAGLSCDKHLKIHFYHKNIGKARFETKDVIVFRIVQESLNNILKHAKATDAWINAWYQNSVLSLEIRDNGCGFDGAVTHKSRGLGLDLLKEQVILLHGTLAIDSKIGKGTAIRIKVPIREKKAPVAG